MLMFSSRQKKKKKKESYPITPQTGVSIPLNPYINFAVSFPFMALKEFVPAPQTHVLLCRTVGGTPGGKSWRTTEQFHCSCRTHFFAELTPFSLEMCCERLLLTDTRFFFFFFFSFVSKMPSCILII